MRREGAGDLVIHLFRGALDFLYPPRCVLCGMGAAGHPPLLCPPCSARLSGRPITFAVQGIPAGALGTTDGDPGRLVRLLKYGGLASLAGLLGAAMAGVLGSVRPLDSSEILVAMPMDPVRRRERGFNQAELLARAISRAVQLPLGVGWLTKKRRSARQTSLAAEARWVNMANSMVIAPGISPRSRRVILVDDVCTTGATLAEARRVLDGQGARVVGAIVAARSIVTGAFPEHSSHV